MTRTTKRFEGEVVELDRACELGRAQERAVVVKLDSRYMKLCFVDRASGTPYATRRDNRLVSTGADYRFLKGC